MSFYLACWRIESLGELIRYRFYPIHLQHVDHSQGAVGVEDKIITYISSFLDPQLMADQEGMRSYLDAAVVQVSKAVRNSRH